MNAVICPYCSKTMRIITNLRTNSARSYFICDGCGSRSPRAKQDFVEDIKGLPTRDRVPETVSLVEQMAYELATNTFGECNVLDMDSESFESAFKIDDDE